LYHEHLLKRCRKLPRTPSLYQNRLRTSDAARQNLAPDRLTGITHHQAPSANRIRTAPSSPGGHLPTTRRLALTVATATVFGLYRLATRPTPPDAIPVAQCYWFLAFFSGFKRPQTYHASFSYQS